MNELNALIGQKVKVTDGQWSTGWVTLVNVSERGGRVWADAANGMSWVVREGAQIECAFQTSLDFVNGDLRKELVFRAYCEYTQDVRRQRAKCGCGFCAEDMARVWPDGRRDGEIPWDDVGPTAEERSNNPLAGFDL